MNKSHLLIASVSLALLACDVPKKTPEEIAEQDRQSAIWEAESRSLDPIREQIIAHLKSDKEPTTKDAYWQSDYFLQIAVKNEGGKYDGYAQYVCRVLFDFKFPENATVQVLDWGALVLKDEYVRIGRADCNYAAYAAPPEVVDFNNPS